jgi:hypothetical protein
MKEHKWLHKALARLAVQIATVGVQSDVEILSYGALGRSVCASQVNKIIYSGCACFCFPSFVDSHPCHVISANLNILSRPA